MVSTRSRSYNHTQYENARTSLDSSGTSVPVTYGKLSPSSSSTRYGSLRSVNSPPHAFHPYSRSFKPSVAPQHPKHKYMNGFRLQTRKPTLPTCSNSTSQTTVTVSDSNSVTNRDDLLNHQEDTMYTNTSTSTYTSESISDNSEPIERSLEGNIPSSPAKLYVNATITTTSTTIPETIIQERMQPRSKKFIFELDMVETILSILLVVLYLVLVAFIVRGNDKKSLLREPILYRNRSFSNEDLNMCWI